MITFSKLGEHGRLGNQLFQYAATLGIADKLRRPLVLPHWKYAEYFTNQIPAKNIDVSGFTQFKEVLFEHDPSLIPYLESEKKVDLFGYFQSEKYWEHCIPYIKNALTFKDDFSKDLKRRFYLTFKKPTIAIHIRRGDYIGNSNYETLPIKYYILALFEHFPDWQHHNLLIFSDDIPYAKVHFDCLPNVFYAEGTSDIEDICLMTHCTHYILSNSSFCWWGAYLGQKRGTKIIRPAHYFAGKLKERCDLRDFYPKNWRTFDHKGKKIDLTDVTFTIPVMFDHKDRQKNLNLTVCLLQHDFNTNIIIHEHGGEQFKYMQAFPGVKYSTGQTMLGFHRTAMLNRMAKETNTTIVANWDADVIVAPLQVWATVESLRAGADMAYPYARMFARVPREPWFKLFENSIDIGIVGDTKFSGMNNNDAESVGGAVLYRLSSFFAGGGENENFISFGPEDAERFHRFTRLGFRIVRTPGVLYHINHYVGINSSNRHRNVISNREEWAKILEMSTKELKEYVSTWQNYRKKK